MRVALALLLLGAAAFAWAVVLATTGLAYERLRDRETGDGRAARFLRALRDGACPLFGSVLGPDHNAAHRDHLHLDRRRFGICR